MKANRAARHHQDDDAGPEVVGALILFGIFVTTIALLNLTAVPQAGLAAEDDHYNGVLAALNGLQTEAEAGALPTSLGATVSHSIDLGPAAFVPKDFFSYFMATPARASGELSLVVDHGNLTVTHYRAGNPNAVVDVGNAGAQFPYGELQFDPHPNFRPAGVVAFEDGGIITTDSQGGTQVMRFAPPITVTSTGGIIDVGIRARVLNGTDFDVGGVAPVRVGLVTEAATLTSPASANARNVTLRLETAYGTAWGAYLNQTSDAAGLSRAAGQYSTTVLRGQSGALDVVTWTVEGPLSTNTNDVRLTTGLGVFGVSVS
jgi:hypothetical protein